MGGRGTQLGLPLHLARDAAFVLHALISIGFDEEARNFMGWLRIAATPRIPTASLQPLYGIDGRAQIEEDDLSHLSGYRGRAR